MSQIETFQFKKDQFEKIRSYNFGLNWPVVYIIEDKKEIYIGETVNVYSRSNQHFENPERRKLERIHIIADNEYNKSATLDIESSLIQYISADGIFKIQNGNQGLLNHNYFDRQRYQAKFERIWQKLQNMSLARLDLVQIRNSDLFKYSPYKALTEDQMQIVKKLLYEIEMGTNQTFVVNGGPGTGKTILATFLMKSLKEIDITKELEVGLVIPMTSLRNTLKKVFKNVSGLRPNMVIGPNEVVNKKYDVLIVDEAHRLRQRKNITNYQSFDITNKKLGLDKTGTELDWILRSSKQQILFYDKGQHIRPSDVSHTTFPKLKAKSFILNTQMRIGAGEEGDKYISFIQDIFDFRRDQPTSFKKYDFQIYDDIRKMIIDIRQRDKEMELCRVVSGYAWPWASKKNPNTYDIEISGLKLRWNSVNQNWVNSNNAINEVGCIHTVQGYDLNYTGVIIGPEITYDPHHKKFAIHSEKYFDINGRRGIDDPKELERYIINIYKTLLTRGIEGTYVYIVDDSLRTYFKSRLG